MTKPTTLLSIASALGFALWVIWLWWPSMDQSVVEQNAHKPQKPVPTKATDTPMARAAILTLPAPPKPAAQSQTPPPLDPKSVSKRVEPKPDLKPEKPTPKAVQKTAAPAPKPEKAKPVVTQKPAPRPAPKPAAKTIIASADNAKEGRALLRVLEHGKGPLIEIAWPNETTRQKALYRTFKQCFGMENAVMDRSGDLYRHADQKGQRWEINLDKFSGFLREASGRLSSPEQDLQKRILDHHPPLGQTRLVRIFPRRVDASLLGGFQRIMGTSYKEATSVQAVYVREGQTVYVDQIQMDGQPVEGRIQLLATHRC